MKASNIVITALFGALIVAASMLAVKIFAPATPPAPEPARTAPVKPASPEPSAVAQPGPKVEKPAPPTAEPRTSITTIEQPVEHAPQKPAAPVKEEPDLRPVQDIKVVMYMTDWWPYCAKARSHLKSLGVDLTEYNIERDSSAKAEMLKKSGGSMGVPLIDVEGIILRGFSPDSIDSVVQARQHARQ